MSKRRPSLLDFHADVTVLAVDTARNSGWAIRVGHRLKYSGEVDTLNAAQLDYICLQTAHISSTARSHSKPILILEQPWGGRANTIMALGMARERWRAAWARVGMSPKRMVSVNPARWRAAVLERGAHCLPREQVREHERLSAQAEVAAHIELGGDERAAILISRWAVRSHEVFGLCNGKGRR